MNEINELAKALQACSKAAEEGYRLAIDSYDAIHEAYIAERKKIKSAMDEQDTIKRIDNSPTFTQIDNDLLAFKNDNDTLLHDIKLLHENEREFSIIVFGRTMAGKSTLMETIKHGQGESIGKGAQRTTRDVRAYHWNGMKIIDVPGIASFDGEEDDQIAMEAAKSADMILFLITDDAPQQEEAKKLADLRNLGKPVLGIINVKQGLNMNRRALAIRGLKKKLQDTDRIQEICEQFKSFATLFGQDWEDIPFVSTHLRAAFLGQESQLNDEELYEASQFPQVEKFIIDKVQNDGTLYRKKTFVDCVAVTMQQRIDHLLDNASISVVEALQFRRKHNEFDAWSNEFQEQTKRKLDDFQNLLKQDVKSEIKDYAFLHWKDKDAGKEWNSYINNHIDFKGRCAEFLQSIADDCARKRRELTDELQSTMRFKNTRFDIGKIEMGSILDTKSFAELALSLAGFAVGGWIGLIAVTVVGEVVSRLMDTTEEKKKKQREKLEKAIEDAMMPQLDKLVKDMDKVIQKEIVAKEIGGLRSALDSMENMFFALAEEERNLAKVLCTRLDMINESLLHAVEQHLQHRIGEAYTPDTYKISLMARIPNTEFICFGTGNIDDGHRKLIEETLGEPFHYIGWSDSLEKQGAYLDRYMSQLLGDCKLVQQNYGKDGKLLTIVIENSTISRQQDKAHRLINQLLCAPQFSMEEVKQKV